MMRDLIFGRKMAPVAGSSQGVSNYLVPAGGGTHAVPIVGVFGAAPFVQDWSQFKIDSFPFQPQGVYVDNSAGAGTLSIEILTGVNGAVFWTVDIPAGAIQAVSFPAPNGHAASITGNGQATVIFVDFPVLPSGTVVTVNGTVNVAITGQPIQTSPTVNAAGTPYQNTEVPATIQPLYSGAITGAVVTTGNMTPTAGNLYLRKLILSMSDNVTLAAAGLNPVTVTLNGNQIYKENVYIPATAPQNVDGNYWSRELDFAKLGLNFAAGNLVVTIGTALATGILDVNAYAG